MTKYLHNSPLFLKLENSMLDMQGQMIGQRNSNYLYHLNAKADGYLCNVFFSPQPQVLLSRVLAAKPEDLENSKIDLTFATDMSAQDFDDLDFNVGSTSAIKEITKILLNLTVGVNFHNNWKYTVSYDKLVKLLSKTPDNDNLLRKLDTIKHTSNDMNTIIKTVIKAIGLKQAQKLIPRAYHITNLASLWFESLRSLKTELDKRGLSHENMQHMNFGNQQKKFKRFTK